MANQVYDNHWKAQYGDSSGVHGAIDIDDNLKIALIDTGTYTFSAAHADYSDLSGVEATSENLANASISVTAGVMTIDADDVTFSGVSGGTSIEAYVLYKDTGTPATSPLIAYVDTGVTGLPVTPGSGDDVTLSFNASGIWTVG